MNDHYTVYRKIGNGAYLLLLLQFEHLMFSIFNGLSLVRIVMENNQNKQKNDEKDINSMNLDSS